MLRIAVIIFAVVVIPIVVFQAIKLATKPASISLEEIRSLTLEEGQELYAAWHDEDYDAWVIGGIRLDVGDTDWVQGFGYVVIENDFIVRHFQKLDNTHIIIFHDTGEVRYPGGGFRIVVVDEWYVLEE